MAYADEVAARIYDAFIERQAEAKRRRQRYTQADLGRGVAERLGRDQPLDQPTVSKWMAKEGASLTDNPTLDAIAAELGVRFEWLVLNRGERYADTETAPGEGRREVSDEEIDDDSMSPAEMEEHLQREGVIPSPPRRRKHRPA